MENSSASTNAELIIVVSKWRKALSVGGFIWILIIIGFGLGGAIASNLGLMTPENIEMSIFFVFLFILITPLFIYIFFRSSEIYTYIFTTDTLIVNASKVPQLKYKSRKYGGPHISPWWGGAQVTNIMAGSARGDIDIQLSQLGKPRLSIPYSDIQQVIIDRRLPNLLSCSKNLILKRTKTQTLLFYIGKKDVYKIIGFLRNKDIPVQG